MFRDTGRRKLQGVLGLTTAVLGAALLAAVPSSAESLTPLGKWMKANVGAPMAGGDLAAVAKGMDFVASKAPAGYTQWAQFAKQGADAARAGDTKGVKASCKACHDAYKQKYRTEHKDTPFP